MSDLVLLLLALGGLWFGSGISIGAVEKISRYIKVSSFFASFVILGTLTSISEISVAFFSVMDKTPSISVGNLIGGSIVLVLFVIPLLAIFNKGIVIGDRTGGLNFNLAYLVVALPALLVVDGVLSFFDSAIIFVSFVFLGISASYNYSLVTNIGRVLTHPKISIFKEGVKVLIGVAFIILSSKFIVDTSVEYAQKLSVSPFLVGVLGLSLGTNLPEISVLIRSTIERKKNIALGDYVGSSVMNSLILVGLTIFNGAPIALISGVKLNILLLPLGSILFLYMTRDGRLKKREGFVLLSLYSVFVITELALVFL